jgi:hypothetical protein
MNEAGFTLSRQRDATIHVYASQGAGQLSRRATWSIAEVLPTSFHFLVPPAVLGEHCLCSLFQIAELLLLPRALRNGRVDDCVAGGWSLGCNVAHDFGLQLEYCTEGIRAAFWVDARALFPRPQIGAVAFQNVNREMASHGAGRVSVALQFHHAAKLRSQFASFDFFCPLRGWQASVMQSDDTVNARRPVYARAGEPQLLPDADHMTVGIHFSWDIARRVRSKFACFEP